MAKKFSKPKTPEQHVARVRRLCLALPEATERLSHGEPTFFVRNRVFATCSINHHDDGHVAVIIPVESGLQPLMLKQDPEKYYYPAYVGVRGWIGIELARVDDEELAEHLAAAWRLIAPKTLAAKHPAIGGEK